MRIYDAIIVGGGPAGLSAALLLGRCRRTVLLLDADQPRNGASRALHGYLTRDGLSPQALRGLGEADIARYPSVLRRKAMVTEARRDDDGFEVATDDGARERSRLLLLATGRIDPPPSRPGFREFFGRGVYHCPYCDAWEHRDQALAVYGDEFRALELARELLTWSDRVTICSDGPPQWQDAEWSKMPPAVRLITDPVLRLEGTAEALNRVCFATERPPLRCDALFFCTACAQRSPLPRQLGCELDAEDSVVCKNHAATGVRGLYVAGNVRGGVHLAITAAAEGAEAAIAMNEALLARQLEA